MLLAIDTSTNYASLALTDGDTLLAELNWRVERRHGSELLERARWLLAGQGVALRDLGGLAVALGPGSFNGLRVALATAKGVAFALDLPLYGLPTLDVIAWGARLAPDPIWAILEAGRGEVYAARYDGRRAAAAWRPETHASGAALDSGEGDGYMVAPPDALAALVGGRATFTGEWRAETQAALTAALGERARFVPQVEARRGVWLAELAAARAAAGRRDDPQTLEPIYLRRPNITTSARAVLLGVAQADQAGAEGSREAQANDQGERNGGEEAQRALQR